MQYFRPCHCVRVQRLVPGRRNLARIVRNRLVRQSRSAHVISVLLCRGSRPQDVRSVVVPPLARAAEPGHGVAVQGVATAAGRLSNLVLPSPVHANCSSFPSGRVLIVPVTVQSLIVRFATFIAACTLTPRASSPSMTDQPCSSTPRRANSVGEYTRTLPCVPSLISHMLLNVSPTLHAPTKMIFAR